MNWISAKHQLPARGQRIVCEFAQGSLWAGKYQGVKQSFVRWMPLP